jgi:NADPH:quinone reductase-like Zn-dependent oxidoreductase
MKATIFKQHGGPDVLEYTDVPEPTIRANEVLVEVKACALNHLDILFATDCRGLRFHSRIFWEVTLPELCARLASLLPGSSRAMK